MLFLLHHQQQSSVTQILTQVESSLNFRLTLNETLLTGRQSHKAILFQLLLLFEVIKEPYKKEKRAGLQKRPVHQKAFFTFTLYSVSYNVKCKVNFEAILKGQSFFSKLKKIICTYLQMIEGKRKKTKLKFWPQKLLKIFLLWTHCEFTF